ncbi:glycoside hydrolase family 3 N-terminal domain-containing protein [Pseudenhygromyxa sp. WMMC2535]|nr:glycoside hydrolase family 3 N-terminal domain-containing protein [Pseudenhygromyxa sp. WMMC2535]
MGVLRDELGYDGLVLSDDIEMRAVADHFSVEARSLGALRAGVDVILACSAADLREEVIAKLEAAPDALVEDALRRVVAFKARFQAPAVVPLSELGPPFASHRALAESLRVPASEDPGTDPADPADPADLIDPTERD